MTERQGVFPPEGTEDGTLHWIIDRNEVTGIFRWGAGLWSLPHYRHAFQPITLRNCQYLGPAPTHKQAQADAADARRFRWLVKNASAHYRAGDDWYSSMIQWNSQTRTENIRAAIDAEMKERGDD